MESLTTPLLTGAVTGAILLIAALGLSLTFGQMGVINMAHGEFLMAGAYATYVTQQVVTNTNISILIALPIAFLVAGLLGILLEVTIISWMYDRPLDTLLVTVGVSLVLQQAAKDIFGAQGDPVRAPDWLHGSISVFGYNWPYRGMFTIALGILALVGLAALLKHSAFGRRIRATVQNRELAETMGISTRTVDRITFFIGSGLAGCRRCCHLAHLGNVPDVRHHLHHPGVPGRGRRRTRAAQGDRDRRVLRGHPYAVHDGLVQRFDGPGHRVCARRGLPASPATRPLHREHEGVGMSAQRMTLFARIKAMLPLLSIVLLALLLLVVAPAVLSPFRLSNLGKYCCWAIAAVGIGLAWGRGGMLVMGQGVFFGIGGYAMAMHLKLDAAGAGHVPDFMQLYGDGTMPWWWGPFRSPVVTLAAIIVLPAVVRRFSGTRSSSVESRVPTSRS